MQFNTALKSKMAAVMIQPAIKYPKTFDDLVSDGYSFIEDRFYYQHSKTGEMVISNT